MNEPRKTWLETTCERLLPIEQETMAVLGEEKGNFFVVVANDWIDITSAVSNAYPGQQVIDLVMGTTSGLFKEVSWLHLHFIAGNYPLIMSRLRFIWESVFRAFYVEHFPLRKPPSDWTTPGTSPDDRLEWLDKYESKLNWNTCYEPVLLHVFPPQAHDPEIISGFAGLYKHLHKYAHPSAYLTLLMVGDSALHATDAFDEEWARETIEIAVRVFDLVWMLVLAHHPAAFDQVKSLGAHYPILQAVKGIANGQTSTERSG